jgi:hypothetical protein
MEEETPTTNPKSKSSGVQRKVRVKKGKAPQPQVEVEPPVQPPVHDSDSDGTVQEGAAAEQAPEETQADQAEETQAKKKKLHAVLSEAQEQDMVEWLRDHPEIYNKKLKSYKDAQSKESNWRDKALLLDLDVPILKTWYNSLRTRFGRLRKKKSGDADPEHTERDTWILRSFEFLAVHIVEVQKRIPCSVSIH